MQKKQIRSVTCRITKKLPDASTDQNQNAHAQEFKFDDNSKVELRCPSPTPAFTEAELLTRVLKRLGELEEKVNTLQAKPSEMPYAVCRVDAPEAELIATKNALHEALMRQEELLAYIDSQEEAKYRKEKFCW